MSGLNGLRWGAILFVMAALAGTATCKGGVVDPAPGSPDGGGGGDTDRSVPVADSDDGCGEKPDPDPCNPPHTAWRCGRCLPSCGSAGGNACGPECEGSPILAAYDCTMCCALPTSADDAGATQPDGQVAQPDAQVAQPDSSTGKPCPCTGTDLCVDGVCRAACVPPTDPCQAVADCPPDQACIPFSSTVAACVPAVPPGAPCGGAALCPVMTACTSVNDGPYVCHVVCNNPGGKCPDGSPCLQGGSGCAFCGG